MLATPATAPFDRAGWIFEVKWDGYRAIAEIDREDVRLYSRNNLRFKRFSAVASALKSLGHEAVLDGEIVVLDDAGQPSFNWLHDFEERKGLLVYQVFDVLHLDGPRFAPASAAPAKGNPPWAAQGQCACQGERARR